MTLVSKQTLIDEVRARLANGSTDANTGLPVRITADHVRKVLEMVIEACYPGPVTQDGSARTTMPAGLNFVGPVLDVDNNGVVTVTSPPT